MKHQIYWTESERLAIRDNCGCRARGKAILQAIGDGVVLALLIGIIALTLYIESV